MGESMKTKIFRVRPDSSSLRGTFPQSVVNSLKLEHGDTIKWNIEVRSGNIVAVIEKE